MQTIAVEFEPGGKHYAYNSPYHLELNDLVVVTTYGKLQIAKVVDTNSHYQGPIKLITGLAYRLEEMEQNVITPQPKQSLLDRILG